MTIVDRYLLFLFLKIFLVCFLSFTGLFIVIHLFSNLDELAALSKSDGWPVLLWDFYGPRIAEVFDKTSAIWILVAAVFAVSLMQRFREMTAIEAAGVSKSRILRPVFLCAILIVGLAIANRELVIPKVKDRLVRTPQNWSTSEGIPLGVHHDFATGIKVRGASVSLTSKRIDSPEIQLPSDIGGGRIRAAWAVVEPATRDHPPGLLLEEVSTPDLDQGFESLRGEDGIVVYGWADQAWLDPGQCFVPSEFDPFEAAYGKKLMAYQSLAEMMDRIRKPKLWFGKGQQIGIHARIMQPVLDLTLLLLGLPLIVGRGDKNVFVSAGLCFLIVGAVHLSAMVSQSLGVYGIVRPAVLAAWLPAIIFVPLAVVSLRRMDR